jgi:lipopolysaccharide export system permease protein
LKLKQYLYSQLAITFFPIFLGLFFITAVIFLVKIASLTSIITINFSELFQLFSYVVPQILFFTMPISFFLSLVITLAKLSGEYELTVITSFGLNPIKILKIFLPITLVVSSLLLIVSVGLIPKTKYLSKQFLEKKKKEANFNIKASEFGQKFGDWLIFINGKDEKVYDEIKLFKTEKKQDQFIGCSPSLPWRKEDSRALGFSFQRIRRRRAGSQINSSEDLPQRNPDTDQGKDNRNEEGNQALFFEDEFQIEKGRD